MIHDADDDRDDLADRDDRPSFARVETFLSTIERRQKSARRARFVAAGVAAAIAGVAFLTAIGVVPVEAENVVLSASVVVAGLTLGSNGGPAPPL